jgi:hypothetical protein
MSDSLSEYALSDFTQIGASAKAFKLVGKISDGKDFAREWEFWVPKDSLSEDDFIPQWILDKEVEKAEAYFGEKAQFLEPQ